MDDQQIIALYFARDEDAITRTMEAYGPYCRSVAGNILGDHMDVEEVLSTVWLRAWNSIPPQKPEHLKLYLARITRNLAINTYRDRNTEKRGGGTTESVLEELSQCVRPAPSPEEVVDRKELEEAINRFLATLSQKERRVFVRRYFYLEDVKTIAGRFGLKQGHVPVLLSRIRQKLKQYLIKEGYDL